MANPFFGLFENSLPPGFCRKVIERFNEDPNVAKGRVGNGTRDGAYNPGIKHTTEISLDRPGLGWDAEEGVLHQSLTRHLKQYMTKWGRAFSCDIRPEPLKIARYPIGGGFDWHSDNLGGGVTTRVITAIWYLNTVGKGGETEYPWQNMSIQPVEGRLLLCPVGWTYVHRGAPPESKPKYIVITQLHQVNPEHI